MDFALSFVDKIAKRKMNYVGHIIWRTRGRLILNILEGHIEGRRRVRRPSTVAQVGDLRGQNG